MRIPSNTVSGVVSQNPVTSVKTPSVEAAPSVQTTTMTLQSTARPLMASLSNMVADFGNGGISDRVDALFSAVEFVDQTKLKGHLPSEDVLFLVDYSPATYKHTAAAFKTLAPGLTEAMKAGQSKPKMESITGGPLDKADFNNFVSKMPNNYRDADRFAVQNDTTRGDTRSQTVRIENIRDVMRDILDSSDIQGTVLAKPFEKPADFSTQDRIEEFIALTAEKKTLAEEFEEAAEKRRKANAHNQISGRPGQPKPIEDRVPSLEILDPTEQALVQDLERRDQEVRAHELAHQSAAGGLAGAATFVYQQGPDGRQYAIGGEVQIQVPSGSTPEDKLRTAMQVRAAATAPANPSPADLQAASLANRMAQEARSEIASAQGEYSQETIERAQQAEQELQALQSEPLDAGRLPSEELTQLAATEALNQRRESRDQTLDTPSELDLQRESARLTVAAPMGAYAQQFKMEEELDRRAFASLELAQEVAGVPTPQVVESREGQADRFEERMDRNASRRAEMEVVSPRIDIQPSGSPDVEDGRFNLTADVQQSKDDLQEEQVNAMVDPIAEKEQMPQLQSFEGLNGLANSSNNAMPRSQEGLASEISDLNPAVPQGVNQDPATLLQQAVEDDKSRFSNLLSMQFEAQQERRSDLIQTGVSIQGNQSSIEIEAPSNETLFQPDHSQIDFSEQTITDSATIAFSSGDTTGPSRLTPMSEDSERMQLTPQQEQSLETAQAIKAMEGMFAAG